MRRAHLAIVGLVLVVFLSAIASSQNSREVTKTVTLKPDGEVSIDTYKGSITVSVWDKPSVEIHATIEADDEFSDKYSEEKVRDTEISIRSTENTVKVKTDYDNIHKHRNGLFFFFEDNGSLPLVHYKITMPATARLRVKDFKSKSVVTGVLSDVEFNTYKGTAELNGIAGSLRFDTYKGEAKISFDKIAGRSRVETYKGDLSIVVPKNLGFDLDADLGYRTDVHTDFAIERKVKSRRHSNYEYQGPVNGGGPSLVLRSTRGSVDLRQR